MGHLSEQRLSQYVSTLREKEGNFAISQTRRPRGFIRVYTQGRMGRLVVRVKNLKQPGRDSTAYEPHYDILLVRNSKNQFRAVRIGALQVDGRGEGEGRWDFAARNIKGTGCSIEDFERVLITARERGPRSKEYIVLDGELELVMAEPFDGLNLEKVDPFGEAMPNHRWWKFYPNHFFGGGRTDKGGDNPVAGDAAVEAESEEPFQPGIALGPVFRGHQLIGLHYDEKGAVSCLVHGIPGRFCAEDQPDGGSSGYVYWQPLPGQSYRKGNYGYWLVHIDPESGEVVYPRKETPPPDRDSASRKDGGSNGE